jgi:hypothetical protein
MEPFQAGHGRRPGAGRPPRTGGRGTEGVRGPAATGAYASACSSSVLIPAADALITHMLFSHDEVEAKNNDLTHLRY